MTTNAITVAGVQVAAVSIDAVSLIHCFLVCLCVQDSDGSFELPLGTNDSKAVNIQVQLLDTTDTIPTHFPFTHNRYKAHASNMAGIITQTTNIDGTKTFVCHSIEMFHVQSIFGGVWQPWNREYANAQAIFGKEDGSLAVRQAIRIQFAALYRDGVVRTRSGYITSSSDFFELIHYGRPNGVPQFYTYVLTDDRFRFSESGIQFTKDFFSKHSMHANCDEQVRYAGEFHIRKDTDGQYALVIDNNSGTYGPDPSVLPLVRKLFLANFPFLRVECLDREDPKLVQSMLQVKNSPSPAPSLSPSTSANASSIQTATAGAVTVVDH
jgi:hypothetical protein